MVQVQQQFQNLFKQNQKSYYSLEKISLLKARYGGEKLTLERPKSFFVSYRHKPCISPILVLKNFQINNASKNNIPGAHRKTASL